MNDINTAAVSEATVENGERLVIELDERIQTADYIKVLISGELAAQRGDRQFKLLLNDAVGYRSFGVMCGDHSGQEAPVSDGIYLGRNGWQTDASVAIELTITQKNLVDKRPVHGLSTFGIGNNLVIGCEVHGIAVSNKPVQLLTMTVIGGLFTGTGKAYAI